MNLINTVLGIPLGYVMWACYQLFQNYAIAIIVFTLISKLVMLPVSIMVQKNSIKMIQIQPQINQIKYKYAGDNDRIADEQLELFKEAHYSPMLGVVPMLLQIPIVLGLINVIYNPMQHLMHISTDICDKIVAATCTLMGVEHLGSGAQLQAMAAMQKAENLSYFQNAFAGTGIDIDAIIAQAATIDTNFLGWDLAQVPNITVFAWILMIPLLSCLSTVLLCVCQNMANVLQREQGAAGQWGVTLFTVAFSTYFTFLVPGGVGLYWIFSNLFSTAQIYILNAIYNPEKYIDYDALEESKKLLAEQKAAEEAYKKKMAPYKAREKADYKRFFAKENENKKLVFYSEQSGFYKYFGDIVENILETTDIVIHYVTSDPEDKIFQKNHPNLRTYYIGEMKLITLMMKLDTDIMVMTMPDLETYHIKRSYVRKDIEYIFIPHSIDSLNMTMRKGSMDHFDTVFCVGPHQKEEIEKTEEVYNLPKKVLLQWGYCLLDDMRRDYEAQEKVVNDPKTVLIAPSWQDDNIVDSCLEEILKNLRATGYRVIVRPHPQHVRHMPEKMEALKQEFAADENIEIQTDFSSNDTVFNADLMITDWSGIAYEYAYTTLKPVLFINTPMKIMNPEYEKVDVVPLNISMRESIGSSLNLDELDKVAEETTRLIEQQDVYHDKIDAFVNEYVYHLGTSAKVGANYIKLRLKQIYGDK
ncbi:MAG: membrane protein insertase YidC [Lachnospiraceae bacterium]|nr:membrane protein insertase YidC [Lachnospiraceae bacterium]